MDRIAQPVRSESVRVEMSEGIENMRVPRFDWSFNFGHVLTSITFVLTAVGGIWWASKTMADIDHRITTTERFILETKPKLDALTNSNTVQDERIMTQGEVIRGIRADSGETNRRLSVVSEGMAKIEAKLDTLIRKN